VATWSWKTDPDGHVEVDQGDGNGFVAISLPAAGDRATAKTEQWAGLAQKYATLYGVPLSWVLAVIYAESGGDPTVGSSDDLGAGLMQLTLSVYGLTRAEAQDPETSVRLGTQTLGQARQRGNDLPAVASVYNAGGGHTGTPHASATDPWGYVETRPSLPYSGYIEKVVRASNYFLGRFPNGVAPSGPSSLASVGGGAALFAVAGGAAAAYYLLRYLFPVK
jgi:soluble lytic murein transglycosylase-like protein